MKRGKIKNKKKNLILIIVIIIFLLIIIFLSIKSTGYAVSSALYKCTESDNGIDYFEKGFCEDRIQKYEDTCYGEKGLWEYYCSNDKYVCIRQETACPYGCENGRCLKKGEIVSANQSSETTPETNNPAVNNINDVTARTVPDDKEVNKNSYLDIISIFLVLIIFTYLILLFVKKSKSKKKRIFFRR